MSYTETSDNNCGDKQMRTVTNNDFYCWAVASGDDGPIEVPLKPTGRWMVKYGANDNGRLYIEHRWLVFFKRWVREEDIYIKPGQGPRIYINGA